MNLLLTTFADIFDVTILRATPSFLPLTDAMQEFEISAPAHVAAFLANVGTETDGLATRTEYWGPTAQQLRYERDPSRPWSATDPRNRLAFELGNSEPGDGKRFMGRGDIMTSGRNNYRRVTRNLRERFEGRLAVPDFVSDPEQLALHEWAAYSAGDFWFEHGLNAPAEECTQEAFVRLVRVINGGTTGLPDRLKRWARARRILGV